MTRISSRFLSDDTSCAAGLYWPNTANSNGPHPVIVMAHGFAGQRNFRLPAFAKHFRAAGFAVLIFDYRTFGDSDGTPRQYINPWRQLVDWRAAIQHVRQLDRVDHRRIILWGSSFSGGHVVSIASEDHAIAGVIAQVPFVSGLATIQQLAIKDLLRMSLAGFGDLLTAFVGLGPLTLPVVNASGKRALLNTELAPGISSFADSVLTEPFTPLGEPAGG